KFRIDKYKDGLNYLINGQVLTWQDKNAPVISPILLQDKGRTYAPVLGEYPLLDNHESWQALQAAKKAYDAGNGLWPQMPVSERLNHLQQFVQSIKPLKEIFSLLEMWEIGKSYLDCRDEFDRTIKYIGDTIDNLMLLEEEGDLINRVDKYIFQVRRRPLGVCLCMGPFNYPLNETFAMLIPALIMGNTAIVKLPRYGSLCTLPLLEAFARSFPPGVINIINGEGEKIIGPVIRSGEIDLLGFIGSVSVATHLINQHPGNNRLRTILGLEAKNPAFILAEADIDLAAKECALGALEFNGQRCTAIKHIWVHESIVDKFLEALCREIDSLKTGMPWEENVNITPLPEEGKVEWLGKLVEDAVSKGAAVINKGGGEIAGNLFYPAVLFPVNNNMKIYDIEQFGPVIPVSSFSRLEELVNYMITSDYGQQASIFSQSGDKAGLLIDILANQVARINLNAQCRRGPDELPFTGRKDSAEGTLSISDALRTFSISSLVVANEYGRDLFLDTLKKGKSKFLKI
ncbi:MAG: aldehyde dehydrogenase family protein, partial [Syntrophomonadaceae bacterium]|nr:aldehyde dehydrogenase family protein [Syntrophomonadaceae bacterium]MDD4549340.1 aldehyde dehydrogenase family protein [Syntrophomonadaceae bacterium]